MTKMSLKIALLGSLTTALAARAHGGEALPRAEIVKRGKAATALLEINPSKYGSAICIHPSGLFLTQDKLAIGDVKLVMDAGLKGQQVFKAKVVRSHAELGLSVLRADGAKDLPALALGSDAKLIELAELVVCGFPFGKRVTADRKTYPEMSVNVCTISSLRRRG